MDEKSSRPMFAATVVVVAVLMLAGMQGWVVEEEDLVCVTLRRGIQTQTRGSQLAQGGPRVEEEVMTRCRCDGEEVVCRWMRV